MLNQALHIISTQLLGTFAGGFPVDTPVVDFGVPGPGGLSGGCSFKHCTGRPSEQVTLYLDGELSKEEERELLLEIQQNPQYVQILGKEKNFREFVKSRLQRKRVSPTLVQSIKDKIRTSV
jgi:hypothetical protein